MDAETKQSLGLALVGAALIAVGFVAQLSESGGADLLGRLMLWGGAIFALVGVLRIAFALMRKPTT